MSLAESDILRILMHGRDRIAAAAWVIVRDAQAAEDIFQNVVIKAMTKEVAFDTDGAVLSWAFITARREAIDWTRRHRRETLTPDEAIVELMERDWLSDIREETARADALRECLRELPRESHELLRLRYFEGLDCKGVAERLGDGLNAVYKRLSRLHAGLRGCVESRLSGATDS